MTPARLDGYRLTYPTAWADDPSSTVLSLGENGKAIDSDDHVPVTITDDVRRVELTCYLARGQAQQLAEDLAAVVGYDIAPEKPALPEPSDLPIGYALKVLALFR